MQVRLERDRHDAQERRWHEARQPVAVEPKVINVDAVLVLGQERTVAWGAITLHAPPLSFILGARLLVAANALRDLREKHASETSIRAAQSVAAAHLREAFRPGKAPKPPVGVGSLRHHVFQLKQKLPRPYLGCWSCLFTKDAPEDIEGLIRWLLDVPDEASYQPPERKVTIDFMDNVAQFAKAFPAWVKDGWPLSWAHYQYGMRHLGRAWVREELRQAAAARAGQAEKKDFKAYITEQRTAAGWY